MSAEERQVLEANYKTATLEQYQYDVLKEWPSNNAKRPALYIWLHVVGHAANICEGIRTSEWKLVLEETAALTLWWLAFIGRLNSLVRSETEEVVFAMPFRPTTVIWQKYPYTCSVDLGLYLQRSKKIHRVHELDTLTDPEWRVIWNHVRQKKMPCRCIGQKEATEARTPDEKHLATEAARRLAVRFHRSKPRGITSIETMFNDVFKTNAYVLSLDEIGFHFMEEVGEVSRALSDMTSSEVIAHHKAKHTSTAEREFEIERARAVNSLKEELADVFSWATNIIAKMQLMLKPFYSYFEKRQDIKPEMRTKIREAIGETPSHLSLADIIWNRYGSGGIIKCDRCGEAPCACPEEEEYLLAGEKPQNWMLQTIQRSASRPRL